MGTMTYALNLALHRIVDNNDTIEDRYTIEKSFLCNLVGSLSKVFDEGLSLHQIRLYFDDNYESCLHFAAPVLARTSLRGIVAVPIETIGLRGHCSLEELRSLKRSGFEIMPHGFSHAALAVYREDVLQPTPPGGLYRNIPPGKQLVPTEEEVLFQFIESKNSLQEFTPVEFVLPYGLYNESVISINASRGIFERLSTCDPFLDSGEILRPRLLVTNDSTPEQVIRKIRALRPRPSAVCHA
jgi:hypothetical protein